MGGLLSTERQKVGRSGGRAHRHWSLAIVWGAILTGGVTPVLFGADWPSPANTTSKNILTNQGVVTLARAGYSEGFIIDIIFLKQTQFDVSADGLAWLAKQGLSERVIRTMVANEHKEEKTAIVPATVQIVTEAIDEEASGRSNRGQSSANVFQTVRTEVPVPLPVIFPAPGPTPGLSLPSWYLKGHERDRWYILPNVPVLPASSR